jgi:hypothetical protein
MDGQRFDAFARSFAMSRRQLLMRTGGGIAAVLAGALGPRQARGADQDPFDTCESARNGTCAVEDDFCVIANSPIGPIGGKCRTIRFCFGADRPTEACCFCDPGPKIVLSPAPDPPWDTCDRTDRGACLIDGAFCTAFASGIGPIGGKCRTTAQGGCICDTD